MTKDYVNEWLKITFSKTNYADGYSFINVRPALVCEDGYKVSVQASSGHYCFPRVDESSYYSEVELGYPSSSDDELLEYAEESDNPTQTIYAYVPVIIVNQVIEKHGGWKLSEKDSIVKHFLDVNNNKNIDL